MAFDWVVISVACLCNSVSIARHMKRGVSAMLKLQRMRKTFMPLESDVMHLRLPINVCVCVCQDFISGTQMVDS